MFSFFFLMIRRPPRSTLFPYTTLFRSLMIQRFADGDAVEPRFQRAALAEVANAPKGLQENFLGRSEGTRLNSSHTVISYAVFCLKKKKEIAPEDEDLVFVSADSASTS